MTVSNVIELGNVQKFYGLREQMLVDQVMETFSGSVFLDGDEVLTVEAKNNYPENGSVSLYCETEKEYFWLLVDPETFEVELIESEFLEKVVH